jgi:hypothetical protein
MLTPERAKSRIPEEELLKPAEPEEEILKPAEIEEEPLKPAEIEEEPLKPAEYRVLIGQCSILVLIASIVVGLIVS